MIISCCFFFNNFQNVAKPVAPPCWTCDRCENGQWECDPVTCTSDQCVDGYFTETNMCCQTCPNGKCAPFPVVLVQIREYETQRVVKTIGVSLKVLRES